MKFIRRTQALGLIAFFAASLFSTSPAEATGTVGVYVEPTTTLPPPPTTATPSPQPTSPPATTTSPPTTSAKAPTASTTTTSPSTTSTSSVPSVEDTDEPRPQEATPSSEIVKTVKEAFVVQVQRSVVVQTRAAAQLATNFISEVAAGRPVADVAADVLPAPVATVVVPAVKTASKFAFPIGLAFAVLAFLVIQQRIDSTDPKLIAAPLALEDDVVQFR